MSGDNVLHGPWAGAGLVPPVPAPGRSPLTCLIDVDYRCPDGHLTHVRFGQPAIPDTWECGKCERTADRDRNPRS